MKTKTTLLAALAITAAISAVAGCIIPVPVGNGFGQAGDNNGDNNGGEGEGEGGDVTRTFECTDPNTPAVSHPSCSTVDDCTVAFILKDCCGTQIATGDSAFDICSFMPQAQACITNDCDCASGPTEADDGTTAANLDEQPIVDCVEHVCTTTFAH